MSDVYKIYHNARCSKSRLTLRILRRQGVEINIVKYLDTPPDEATLLKGLKTLGRAAMVRKGDDAYREHVYPQEKKIQDEALAALMREHPSMIQRPLVVAPDGRMAMGRPPENVEALFE